MYRRLASQKSSRALVARFDLGVGLPERLALDVFGVLCLVAFLLESPVPMAIAP